MGEVASLSSVGRAPDCSCVKTNVSADIRVSPVQVWERGPTTLYQFQRWSTLNREVERFQTHPLSWERGPHLQRSASAWPPLNREVERFQTLPLSWEREPTNRSQFWNEVRNFSWVICPERNFFIHRFTFFLDRN